MYSYMKLTKAFSLCWKLNLLLVISTSVALACGKDKAGNQPPPPPTDTTVFTNPLLPSGPDPWVIQKGSTYYYTHTLANRIAIWSTPEVSELKNAPVQIIYTPAASGPDSRDLWAPEIHFIDNKWYVYYAADDGNNANHRMYVLENASLNPLTGVWQQKGKIADPTNKWAIDGTVFNYNNQLYMIWSGWEGDVDVRQNLYIAKMSNPFTIDGPRVMISTPAYDWETIGSPDVNEGPEILKNPNGKIFLTYSASGCWNDDYSLGLLSLKDGGDPLNAGDWTKSATPVFTKNAAGAVYAPGHNSFFKSKDGTEDWILYHANSQPGQGCGDTRNPRAQKFTWNSDGTPNFGQPVATGQAIKKPSGE